MGHLWSALLFKDTCFTSIAAKDFFFCRFFFLFLGSHSELQTCCSIVEVFCVCVCVPASKNVSDWWLSYWISQLKNNGSSFTNGSLSSSSTSSSLGSAHLLLFTSGGLL